MDTICYGKRMKPSDALDSNRAAIRHVVESHHVCNPHVSGSVVHNDDVTEGSDFDLLINPTPETRLFDIGTIWHELLQLLGVPVDVLTLKGVGRKVSGNRSFRGGTGMAATSNVWLITLLTSSKLCYTENMSEVTFLEN